MGVTAIRDHSSHSCMSSTWESTLPIENGPILSEEKINELLPELVYELTKAH